MPSPFICAGVHTEAGIMSRRPVNLNPRRFAESAETESLSPSAAFQTSQSSPLVSVCLVLLGAVLLLGYSFSNSGEAHHGSKMMSHGLTLQKRFSKSVGGAEGDYSSRPECGSIACQATPLLQEVYGKTMKDVLHIGPGTCGVVLKLLKEEKLEAWGIQPFDPKPPVHSMCENLIRKGLVRVADVLQRLPYKQHSFSVVLVTDTVESLTGRQFNRTLPELARVSSGSLVLFISSHGPQWLPKQTGDRIKALKSLKPRNKEFWRRRLQMAGLKEDEERTKIFDHLQLARSFNPDYYIFHIASMLSARFK